jgi:hypothetical protein
METFEDTIKELGNEISPIIKEGFFFLSDRSKLTSPYWIDLLELSSILENFDTFSKFKYLLFSILNYLYTNDVNTIILPRWTNTTEDLFASTLYRLRLEKSNENFVFYEILKMGEEGFCICSTKDVITRHKAIAIIGLDIHMHVIHNLMDFMKRKDINIEIPIILSIMSRGIPDDIKSILEGREIYSLFEVLLPPDSERAEIIPITDRRSKSGELLFGKDFEKIRELEEFFDDLQ